VQDPSLDDRELAGARQDAVGSLQAVTRPGGRPKGSLCSLASALLKRKDEIVRLTLHFGTVPLRCVVRTEHHQAIPPRRDPSGIPNQSGEEGQRSAQGAPFLLSFTPRKQQGFV
jgi:hypothetical protein